MWDADHLRVRFELGGHGWSSLYLEKGDMLHVIHIKHIFEDDPIESLIHFAEDLQSQNYPTRAVFQDEPGTHILELSVAIERTPILKLFSSPKNFQSVDKAEEVASFEVAPSFIATQIFAELQRIEILMRHRLYQKDRTRFPFKRFKQMKTKFNLC